MKGFALMLIVAAGACAALTLAGVKAADAVRQRSVRVFVRKALSRVHALSAVNEALYYRASGNVRSYASEKNTAVRDEKGYEYAVTAEGGRLNINTADRAMLARLCEGAGLLASETENFMRQTLDNPQFQEDGIFRLRFIEEAFGLQDMETSVAQRMLPYLTTFGNGKVAINDAGPQVLSALGFTDSFVSGLLAWRAGEDGVLYTEDDRYLNDLSGETEGGRLRFMTGQDAALLVQKRDMFSTSSSVWRISARGYYEGENTEITAVVKVESGMEPNVIWWYEQ